MKYRRLILAAAMVLCGLAACDKNPYGPTGYQPDNGGKEEEEEKEDTTEVVVPATFAKGADISWVTQMEEDGVEFYNATGKETECTELMKGSWDSILYVCACGWIRKTDGATARMCSRRHSGHIILE